jgi:hypothetical protein
VLPLSSGSQGGFFLPVRVISIFQARRSKEKQGEVIPLSEKLKVS